MKKNIKYLYIGMLCLLNIFVFTNAYAQSSGHDIYRVMADSYAPPFAYTQEKKEIGFDIDILNAIAAEQGFRLIFQPHSWKGMFDTLTDSSGDIITAGITITNERRKKMDFTNPYFESKQTLLFDPKVADIHSFEQIANFKVAVESNTTSDALMQKFGNSAKIQRSNTIYNAIKKMLMKNADAALGDLGSIYYYKHKFSNLALKTMTNPQWVVEDYGFAVRKGNIALLNKLNQGLKAIKENGTYEKIYKKWFSE